MTMIEQSLLPMSPRDVINLGVFFFSILWSKNAFLWRSGGNKIIHHTAEFPPRCSRCFCFINFGSTTGCSEQNAKNVKYFTQLVFNSLCTLGILIHGTFVHHNLIREYIKVTVKKRLTRPIWMGIPWFIWSFRLVTFWSFFRFMTFWHLRDG